MSQNDKNSESKNTEMIYMKANEYYYDFAHLFFVERDTNSVYSICNHIFDQCIKQFEQKLAGENINYVAFHFNPQTKKIDTTFLHILFLFAMSQILYDIFAITKEDFNQLFGSNPNTLNNEANYESKNNNKTKVLSSAIWTIIQNKQQETKIVDYLYAIMCNKAQVNMQTFNNNEYGHSDEKNIKDNTTEQNIKSFTYQYYLTIMARLISDQYGKLNYDLRRSYKGILRQYFNFTNYVAWNQSWHNAFSEKVVRDVFFVYREEYYNMIIEHPDYLLNFDADKCWETWNSAYSYSNVKKKNG